MPRENASFPGKSAPSQGQETGPQISVSRGKDDKHVIGVEQQKWNWKRKIPFCVGVNDFEHHGNVRSGRHVWWNCNSVQDTLEGQKRLWWWFGSLDLKQKYAEKWDIVKLGDLKFKNWFKMQWNIIRWKLIQMCFQLLNFSTTKRFGIFLFVVMTIV